jgi:putative addiction module component (TIGR02574 family)
MMRQETGKKAMTLTYEELRDATAGLPRPQRAELAQLLIESLAEDDLDWSAAWKDELAHRLEEIRSGQAVGIPIEEVLDRLRQRYP